MKDRLRSLLADARRHAYWIALPAATLVVVAVSILAGGSAAARAEAWRERGAEVRATERAIDAWARGLEPLAPAETVAWRSSARSVRERGIDAADRVALMQLVAQRAEELGVRDVRVGFVPADTIRVRGSREVSGDVFEMAPYALSLRFTADYQVAARVVGALPPQVDVRRMGLAAAPSGVEADLLLLVYLGVSP